ncbi:sodium channel protein type 4 subunit alpha B-like [Symphorus nematophorus]
MTRGKKSFFEFWRSKKERGELLERANHLRLHPSQLKRLLGDSGIRAALQDVRMASLLPPVGTEVFRRFTPASLEEIQQQREAEEKEHKNRKNKEVEEEEGPKPANDLEAEKPLPFIYPSPPAELLCTPLEELDPFYRSQKTFVVLGKGNIIHRFNADPSCFLLSPFSPLRTVAINVLIQYVFIAVYTFEVIVKVASRGFCVGRFTFLRDPWNWLDVLLIVTVYVSEFVSLGKITVLAFVIPVLKLIPLSPGLKTTVRALVQSIKRLVGVFALMAFCLSILAMACLHYYMLFLRNKCVIDFTYGYYGNKTGNSDFNFTEYVNNEGNFYYVPGSLEPLLCGNTSNAMRCPEGFTCLRGGRNPNYGFTNFDSFGWSLLSVLRLMMQDFWDDLVLMVLQVSGTDQILSFMVVLFPVCFCALSLTVAVVAMVTCEREEAAAAKAKQIEKEFGRIVEVLRGSEEEEQLAGSRAVLSEKQDGEKKNGEQKLTMEGLSEDRQSCPPCWFVFANLVLRWNCCGCWRWLKRQLHTFVMNPLFDLGIIACLIINTIFLAMEHYPMTEQFEHQLAVSQLVFTAIFTAEMVVKLVAMDPYGYFQVSWNVFDCIIVVFSLLELGLADMEGLLRCAQLLRLFRLARWWPEFHLFLKIMWTSVRALRQLTVLLVLVVFVYAVVGIQLFRKDYKECVCRIATDCELPRWHMTDFFHAILVVLMVLFGEWIENLWDCMEVSGQATCLMFFMTFLFIGTLLVLNLFFTLLLSSLSGDVLLAAEQKDRDTSRIKTQFLEHVGSCLGKMNPVKSENTAVHSGDEHLVLSLVSSDRTGNRGNLRAPIAAAEIEIEENKKREDSVQRQAEVQQDGDDDNKADTPEDCCCDKCYRCCPVLDVDTSRGTGRVWSNFRRACLLIVRHRYFEIFIIVIIVLSSAALVFEDVHLQHRPILKAVLETADQVFTYLFLLEMLLKWISFGLKTYFRDAWCWIDFLVLDVFLVSLVASMLGFSGLRAVQFIRTLRALGPLRAVSRFQGTKVAAQSLSRTVPSLIAWLLVSLMVWLFFSILGVNLFAGKFSSCLNSTSETMFGAEEVKNRSECLLMEQNDEDVRWTGRPFNYDHVGNAYLSLMLVCETDRSVSLLCLHFVLDVRPLFCLRSRLYLSPFCLHCGGTYVFMTEEQQIYSWNLKRLFPKKPQRRVPRPQNRCLARFCDLVSNPYYEVLMVVVICLNVVVLMLPSAEDSHRTDEVLYFLEFSFILIFLIEFLVKIVAFRQHYFTDGWNVVDFVVLLVSIIGLFIEDLMARYFLFLRPFVALRLGRVGRVLYFIRWMRGIRKLLLALMRSLPALFNLGLLLFLLMFSWSIFGMWNFPYVKKDLAINDVRNFETFWRSLICVFTIGTSSTWSDLLTATIRTPPDCDPDFENPGSTVTGNCGSPVVAIVFFNSYLVLSSLLVLHMYIVVLLETFDSEDEDTLSDEQLQMFYNTWTKFDPDGSQFIDYSQLSEFCDVLRNPLRIPKPNAIKLVHMDLPLFAGDKVHWVDILLALAAQVLDGSVETDSLKDRMEAKFSANSTQVLDEPISSTLRRKQEEVAAARIQRAYRRLLLQHGDGGKETVGGASLARSGVIMGPGSITTGRLQTPTD